MAHRNPPVPRLAVPLLLALALALPGCDALSGTLEEASAPASERPEGWESLEGEEAALRLYYQFVDAAGRVRFVERLEDVPEAKRESVGFVKMASAPPLSPADAARTRRARTGGGAGAAAGAAGSGPLVLYSAEWCGACRKAKRHLARRDADYQERDVDIPAVAEELRRKTGSRAIPVLDANGRILTGFSPRTYDAILDRV